VATTASRVSFPIWIEVVLFAAGAYYSYGAVRLWKGLPQFPWQRSNVAWTRFQRSSVAGAIVPTSLGLAILFTYVASQASNDLIKAVFAIASVIFYLTTAVSFLLMQLLIFQGRPKALVPPKMRSDGT
jgi:hypothetical protein